MAARNMAFSAMPGEPRRGEGAVMHAGRRRGPVIALLLVGAILAACVVASADESSPGPHLCSALASEQVSLAKTFPSNLYTLPSGNLLSSCGLSPSSSFLKALKEDFAPVILPQGLSSRSPPFWL